MLDRRDSAKSWVEKVTYHKVSLTERRDVHSFTFIFQP